MLFFIVGLVISGVTAFPLLLELRILAHALGAGAAHRACAAFAGDHLALDCLDLL